MALVAPAAALASPPAQMARADALIPLLNGEGAYARAFSDEFRAHVSEGEWRRTVMQLHEAFGRAQGIAAIRTNPDGTYEAQIRYERGTVRLAFALAPSAPYRFTGLRIVGTEAPEASLDAVAAAIRALPGTTGFVLSRLGDGAPVPVLGIAPDRPLAIGSAFKLILLATLIDDIEHGRRQWDDRVTLDGTPLPGGHYATQPAGSSDTLQAIATRMIAVSDNSAADLMLATLGRGRVEAMLPVVGIANPGGMRPFLSTLDMFKLKGVDGGAIGDRWLSASEEQRRALLSGPVASAPTTAIPADLFQDNVPNRIGIEWYASPDDLVRVMDWLRRHTAGGPGAVARAILSHNPGVAPAAARHWAYLGYKGGSEPGVLDMTFVMRAGDGDWYALSAGWNDPDHALAEGRFFALIGRAITLAAAAARPDS